MNIWIYTVEEEQYAEPIVRLNTSLEDRQRAFVADILEDDRNPDDFDEDEEDAPSIEGLKKLKDAPIAEQFSYAVDLYDAICSQGDNELPYYNGYNDGPVEVGEPKDNSPEAEYVARGGCSCPVCKSTDIEGRGVEVLDTGHCYQPCSCNECGSEWNDTYKLTGYAELVNNLTSSK